MARPTGSTRSWSVFWCGQHAAADPDWGGGRAVEGEHGKEGRVRKGKRQAQLEQLFLSRLARLVALWQDWTGCVGSPVPELLEYAVYSTYLDCVRLGLRAEARQLVGWSEEEEGGRR